MFFLIFKVLNNCFQGQEWTMNLRVLSCKLVSMWHLSIEINWIASNLLQFFSHAEWMDLGRLLLSQLIRNALVLVCLYNSCKHWLTAAVSSINHHTTTTFRFITEIKQLFGWTWKSISELYPFIKITVSHSAGMIFVWVNAIISPC